MNEFKQTFKNCMRFLYPGPVSQSQKLDLLKVFVMGWCESAGRISPAIGLIELNKFEWLKESNLEELDDTWNWW